MNRPVTATWRGLQLIGTYSRERASRECPASETAHLTHILCDDEEAEAFSGCPEDARAVFMAGRHACILSSAAEFWLLRTYPDDIDAALCAAGREQEDAGDRDDD